MELSQQQPKHNVEYDFGIISEDVFSKIDFKIFSLWILNECILVSSLNQNNVYNRQVLFSVQKWNILFGKSDSLVHT